MKGALLDSVQGLFAGLVDGWRRPLFGLLALPLGFGVIVWPIGTSEWVILAGILGVPVAFVTWCGLGLLGFIGGFLLLLTIGFSFVSFCADYSSKKSWFILWSASCALYIPLMRDASFARVRWEMAAVSVAIFIAFTFLYWWGGRLLRRLVKGEAIDK